ncbi:MAG: mechanosensitive ion channel [Gammaproteobacteria bacterium]|nr:mechanosensitive ion channel [Gammaproteobacteria bacterium]
MADEQTLPAVLDMVEQQQLLREALPLWSGELTGALARAFQGAGDLHWLSVLLLMIVAGIAVEQLGNAKLRHLTEAFRQQHTGEFATLGVYAIVRVVFDLVGLALFWTAAKVVLTTTVPGDVPVALTLDEVLAAIVSVRGFVIVVRTIFSPQASELRLLALSDDDARAFYRWLFAFSSYYCAVVMFFAALLIGQMLPVLARATFVIGSGSVALMFLLFILTNRERIARQFVDPAHPPGRIGQFFGRIWPVLAVVWMVILNLNWTRAVFLNDVARMDSLQIAWWVTLLFPLVDRLFHTTLRGILNRPFVTESPFASKSARFAHVLQTWFRVLLVAVALFALAVAWEIAGISLLQNELGQRTLAAVINIGVTLLAAYIMLEVGVAFLDQKMPVASEEAEIADGEGGGAGATRAETLAPLIRGTFIVVLVVVVLLSVLSALGIEVAPLLAGAGVFGIALGFGAQKLVQDIISGLFFLLDDAFRRGEYIDVGSVKGTVEKISIRSMQLRHHMGNLHTIPFGEIRYLTNYSRDWVMMKLKLRLAYGTDPEKVRKLVKKLGQELQELPEVGEKFMEPLKSQGVFSMEDDSAMIFRVKFMTKPGDQFVVRKAVYAAIHDRFEREGIQFAHRVVTVKVEDDAGESQGRKEQIAAAALPAIAPAAGVAKPDAR